MGYNYDYFVDNISPKLYGIKDKNELFNYTIEKAPELIDGDGCTIFIFNPKTKKLEISASNGIKDKDFLKSTYEEGEGFTGWVFKYGKPLYIPDETDENYLNKIGPFPPEHAGKKKNKVCEIEAIGPFLAEPIHIGRYVVGVIRIPGAKGDKNLFTDAERALFHIFAEKLSDVIDIKTFKNVIDYAESQPVSSPIRKLITTYREIEQTSDIEDLFSKVVINATDILDASGCTIFLKKMENGKEKFYVKATSSDLVKKSMDDYFYEEGEGFTGAVGKVGKSIILLDLNNPGKDRDEWVKQNKVGFVPKHKGLLCEISTPGTFIAVPIKVENKVIGVIRAVREKNQKVFDKLDLELLESFSNQIGSTLTIGKFRKFEQFRKLIDLIYEIEQTNDKNVLYNIIVNDVLEIIDVSGCTIFLSTIENETKKFIIEATSSKLIKDFKGRFHYKEGEGFTGAVGKVGKSLILSDLNESDEDIKEWIKQNKVGFVPKHEGLLCEIPNPGPFMAVPIKVENEIIGVIRVVREKGQETFDKFNLKLLNSFSNQLGLTVQRIDKTEEFRKIKQKRVLKINSIFSKQLLELCGNLENFTFSKEIENFIKNLTTKFDDDIESSIMSSLEELWNNENRKYNFNLFQDFKDYENYLYELPHYRDHFIHQYQVFLLGSCIIDKLYDLSDEHIDDFASLYSKSLNLDDSIEPSLSETAWLITSTFHDIAYPIEKIDQLLDKFFKKFMDIDERLFDDFHFEPILCGEYQYLRYIDQFSDIYYYLKLKEKRKKWEFNKSGTFAISINEDFRKNFFANFMKKRDHGILSSLILLNQNEIENKDFSSIIFPSALAIALHNKLILDLGSDIIFERNPLTFLLIYCDLVHEWGRDRDYLTPSNIKMPCLEHIKIFKDDNLSKIVIETKIKLTDIEQIRFKKEELRNIFSRLKSINYIFKIIIENEPPPFISEEI